jgi:S-adenosylmethionine:tRNA ribosyltransferase-isomerase
VIAAAGRLAPSPGARLLVVDSAGGITHHPRSALPRLLHPGDLLIANDAATIPASLTGIHVRTGRQVEVRLAGRPTLSPDRVSDFTAIVFGEGDFRIRTEDRPAPPPLHADDRLALGPLCATVLGTLAHPRLIAMRFDGSAAHIWGGIARHSRAIQYAHVPTPLPLWDTWTPFAAVPAAFEPPSAGFAFDWRILAELHQRGIGVATLTHAAGISSTGDPALDARLPFDEAYRIPAATGRRIQEARAQGGRITAIGTTVVRALEHASRRDGRVQVGDGIATQRVGAATRLRVVDALISGTHERGTSHHDLLRAFVTSDVLTAADAELDTHAYRTHEFGDSILVEAARCQRSVKVSSMVTSTGTGSPNRVPGRKRHCRAALIAS